MKNVYALVLKAMRVDRTKFGHFVKENISKMSTPTDSMAYIQLLLDHFKFGLLSIGRCWGQHVAQSCRCDRVDCPPGNLSGRTHFTRERSPAGQFTLDI